MLEHLAQQEAQGQQSFLQMIGAPAEAIDQYNQASQFPADVLYGAYGEVPGTALSQQGAAFGSATAGLPSIFGNQLSFNQNIHAQELAQQNAMAQAQMAHARQMAAADMASSGGGEAGGLTPYQAASLEMRALEFQTEQGRYAQQDELDWLKFEAELEQDELERQERENTAAADALLYQGVIMLAAGEDPFKNKKYMAALNQALGMGSASAAGALTGAATGASEDAAAAKADAIGRRTDKREDIRSIIASQFGGLEPGMNKKNAVSTIMGAISTQYPKFAGWKPDRVRNMVRQHVNSQWDNYRAGSKPSGGGGAGSKPVGFNKQWDSFEAGTTLRSSYKDYVSSLGEGRFGVKPKPSYKTAFARTMGAVRAKWGGKWNRRVRTQVARRIHSYLRSQGLKRPPRRGPRPNMSGSGL